MGKNKFQYLKKAKEVYDRGENVIRYLQDLSDTKKPDPTDILISYDLQSGNYIKDLEEDPEFKETYVKYLSASIETLEDFDSIMEVGVGEATTLGPLLRNLRSKPRIVKGLDISWSRLKFAKNFLEETGQKADLFVGDLFKIPLPSNSIDIVYTSHSIEPNGGREKEALMELYRVTKSYIILLEPSYAFANEEGKARMETHGYVKNLYGEAKSLGYNVIEHRLFDHMANPLNPTCLTIIQKENSKKSDPTPSPQGLICPITSTRLKKKNSFLHSEEAGLVYPVLEGIPCLLEENAILATHLSTDYKKLRNKRGNQKD